MLISRPEGALTPEELEGLLDKHGTVRVYIPFRRGTWRSFTKEPAMGPKHPARYSATSHEGGCYILDWEDVCYGMTHCSDYHIFTNYWLYYAYLLRQGEHEELLP